MAYLVIALLGGACGALLSWYLLIPVVTLVAVGAGSAGAIRGYSFGGVLADTALTVCVLEVSWLASALTAIRLIRRKAEPKDEMDRSTTREHVQSEYEG